MNNDNSSNEKKSPDSKPSIFQVIASVLSAFFGVQNSKNKERDFKHGNHRTFIIIGIIMTFVFIMSVFMIVQLVIYNSK